MSPKKRANYRAQADRWFSQYIRRRDERCQECGSTEFLQCAHLISRSYKAIRTSSSNAVALCRNCHVRFTHRPLEWELWIVDRFGEDYYLELKRQALSVELAKQIDWKDEAAYWKGLVEGVGV